MKDVVSISAVLSMVALANGCQTTPPHPARGLTLSSATVSLSPSGSPATIELRLEPAIRYSDAEPWSGDLGGAEKAKGHLWAVLKPAKGQPIVTDLSRLLSWDDDVWFGTAKWEIRVSDIDGNGVSEFNVGRYGTSEWWSYRILTFTPEGSVVLFPAPELLVQRDGYSMEIETIPNGFRVVEQFSPEPPTWVTYQFSASSGWYVVTSRKAITSE
jgi:hypothetical protein